MTVKAFAGKERDPENQHEDSDACERPAPPHHPKTLFVIRNSFHLLSKEINLHFLSSHQNENSGVVILVTPPFDLLVWPVQEGVSYTWDNSHHKMNQVVNPIAGAIEVDTASSPVKSTVSDTVCSYWTDKYFVLYTHLWWQPKAVYFNLEGILACLWAFSALLICHNLVWGSLIILVPCATSHWFPRLMTSC